MTIFGFNTDVKHAETTYHVQSEARPSDLLVQTLVFVKGQCVGKKTVSYAHNVNEPNFSDEAIHELLKSQHRTVVESITAGQMESALGVAGDVQDIGGSGLSLNWVKAEPIGGEATITLHFQVSDGGRGVAGAEVVSRVGIGADAPVAARGITDNSGNVKMRIAITDELRREAAILVQATHGRKSATRKFRFKQPEQQ
ncbi:MAG TPA: hypothetical protein VKE71_02160 [Candidatus Angelobacter sp.]|nr:hypothetical protein [Candidatus Angelobacter sp.]